MATGSTEVCKNAMSATRLFWMGGQVTLKQVSGRRHSGSVGHPSGHVLHSEGVMGRHS